MVDFKFTAKIFEIVEVSDAWFVYRLVWCSCAKPGDQASLYIYVLGLMHALRRAIAVQPQLWVSWPILVAAGLKPVWRDAACIPRGY